MPTDDVGPEPEDVLAGLIVGGILGLNVGRPVDGDVLLLLGRALAATLGSCHDDGLSGYTEGCCSCSMERNRRLK